MSNDWQVANGTGWIGVPGFGRISPRSDNEDGGRQYFNAETDDDEYAKVTGEGIRGGPETWYFEFDDPFFLADSADNVLEMEISPLPGGRYAVKYRPGVWPGQAVGGWS